MTPVGAFLSRSRRIKTRLGFLFLIFWRRITGNTKTLIGPGSKINLLTADRTEWPTGIPVVICFDTALRTTDFQDFYFVTHLITLIQFGSSCHIETIQDNQTPERNAPA
jgi:hypothetical protein